MAKFCGNCGTQLDDSAKICGNCGTPLDGAPSRVPGLKALDTEKVEKAKKTIKRLLIPAILLVVAVLAFRIISQYTGYNGLLRKVMAAYEKYDIDTLVSVSSDSYFYGESDWVEQYFKYAVADDLDSLESSVGHSYKFSYKVDEIYPVSERRLAEMLSDIEMTYRDFDTDLVEGITIAKVTVTAKQGSKSVNRNVEIVMTKEGGKYRLLYIQ